MNIIFVAYGCSYKSGGEYKMGWSIPYYMAEYNNVVVITRSCFKKEHEEQKDLLKGKNIKFYYVDNIKILTYFFKGQLEPIILQAWNRNVFKFLKTFCQKNNFDIIHQITPIEFRSLGKFGKIKDIKFVVGPLGGAEYMPKSLEYYIPNLKIRIFEIGRKISNFINKIMLFFRANRIDYAMIANDENFQYLARIPFKNRGYFHDTGIDSEIINSDNIKKVKDKICFLTAGRLVYRKGHMLLIDAISELPDVYDTHFYIAGDGPMREKLIDYAKKKGIENKITFLGKIPYEEMKKVYEKSDVFIMPSLRETSGTVMLEALANGMPIISSKAYGAKKVINEDIGILYEINENRLQVVNNLKNAIIKFIENPNIVYNMSLNCIKTAEKYTWENKCKEYCDVYKNLLEKFNKSN